MYIKKRGIKNGSNNDSVIVLCGDVTVLAHPAYVALLTYTLLG